MEQPLNFNPTDLEQCKNLLKSQGVELFLQDIPLPRKQAILYEAKGQEKPQSWYVCWRHGFLSLDGGNRDRSRHVAALFVHLWLKGVDADLARDLACRYFSKDGIHMKDGT